VHRRFNPNAKPQAATAMTLGFLNLAILVGMAALAIPPIIHFLNRRRHDVVDWGAMQFLHVNPAKKRRLFIEELLLMALRMGLIALLVSAFAAPYVSGPIVAGWTRTPRDTVLVLDVSGSMALTQASKPTPRREALEWIDRWLEDWRPGDRAALCLAGQPPQLLELTSDATWFRDQLARLPEPRGGADGPRAVHRAWQLLRDHGQAPRRDIVILSDRQQFGWTDAASLLQWQQLARNVAQDSAPVQTGQQRNPVPGEPPIFWLVQLGDETPAAAANYRLAPLDTARRLTGVGQRLRFRTALHFDNFPRYVPPRQLRVEVNGQPALELAVPAKLDPKTGQASLTFEHRFASPGVHLVSIVLEPDPEHDALPGDNRQDLAIEAVQQVPIVLVDGDERLSAQSSTHFLAQAFADPADDAKVSFVLPRRLTHAELEPKTMLLGDARPSAVILADVPRLTPAQQEGLAKFLADGGGVLVVLGPRADAKHYNDELWRGGAGWLPARMEQVVQAKPGQTVSLDVQRFMHPALELFRDEPHCTLGQAGYTRWWRLVAEAGSRAAVGAMFTSADPWLIEQRVGKGRVIMSALPMDRSWDGHLPRTWEFPVLAHELVYTLADARGGDCNLAPGQGLRIDPRTGGGSVPLPARCTLHGPGQTRSRTVAAWPMVWEDVGPAGVYRLEIEQGQALPIVVHGDPRESDLTPRRAEDVKRLSELVPLRLLSGGAGVEDAEAAATSHEVWWLFLAAAIVFLCGELWLTRRMALARGRS
jgi:hypothetical protein